MKSFLQYLGKAGALINGFKALVALGGRSTSSNGFINRFHALISRAILKFWSSRTELSLAIRHQALQGPAVYQSIGGVNLNTQLKRCSVLSHG